MMKPKDDRATRAAVAVSPPEPEKEKGRKSQARRDVRATVILPAPVHKALRQLSVDCGEPMQALFKEALDLLFTKKSRPAWDDLVNASATSEGSDQ